MKAAGGSVWVNLVVAILSVNNYPLDRTFERLQQLESAGLLDPGNLRNWDISQMVRHLGAAGYNRGPVLTKIMGERLVALAL